MSNVHGPKIQKLLDELQNGKNTTRRAAAYKLGNLRDTAAIPALLEATKDEDTIVRQNSLNALHEINTNDLSVIPLSATERFWAAMAHFSFLLYIPIAFIGGNWLFAYTFTMPIAISIVPLICFIIYQNFKKRSRYTAFHSFQAMIFHPIFPIIVMTIGLVFDDWLSNPESATGAGMILGMCTMPIYILPGLSLLNGIQTALGNGFKYPIIGTWVEEQLFISETQK